MRPQQETLINVICIYLLSGLSSTAFALQEWECLPAKLFVSTLLALNLNCNFWYILVCFRLQSPIHWLQSPKAHKELCPKTGILLKINIRMLLAGGRPEAPLAKVEAVHLKSPRMIRGGTILGRSVVCTGLNLTLPQVSAYGHKEKHGLNHSNECKAFLNAEYLFAQLQPRKISELCNCKPMVHNWVNFILFYKNKTVLPCFQTFRKWKEIVWSLQFVPYKMRTSVTFY